MKHRVRRTVGLGALICAVMSVAMSASALPNDDSIVQIDLVDSSRGTVAAPGLAATTERPLPTTVYLPATTDPAPLIVLAHGAAGSPEKFTDLAAYWADNGYVVAVPRFPLTNDEVPEAVLGDYVEQGRDVRFVIDEMTARSVATGEFEGRIDPERIGLYGLSLGSLTVWSALFEGSGEPRVDAVIQSDGLTLVDRAALDDIVVPVFIAHSDVDPIFRYDDLVATYDVLVTDKYLLTLHGAGHATVGENTITAADQAYRQATTAFWDRTLGSRPTAAFPPAIDGVTSFDAGPRITPELPGTR